MSYVESDLQKRIELGEKWASYFLTLDTDGSWELERLVETARESDPGYYVDIFDAGLGLLEEQAIQPPDTLLSAAEKFLASLPKDDDPLQEGLRIRINSFK